MNSYFFAMRRKKEIRRFLKRAGVERIELPSAVLETDVLPLYDTPNIQKMVTCTGFEPVSAAVKGRCVKPLHQHATLLPNWCLNIILKGLSNCKTFFFCVVEKFSCCPTVNSILPFMYLIAEWSFYAGQSMTDYLRNPYNSTYFLNADGIARCLISSLE